MEEVQMKLSEFQIHFIRRARKYLLHHFKNIMSYQAPRNLCEKMATDERLVSTLILASDYSPVDGHSQDQLNQTVQLHLTESDCHLTI